MRNNSLKTVLSTLALTSIMFVTVVTSAIASPVMIYYQHVADQSVQVNYLDMLNTGGVMRTAFVTALTTCENYGDPIYVIDSSETVIDYEVALTKSVAYSTDLKSMPTNPGGTAPFANYLMNADGTLTPIQGSNVNAINTTKTTATYGISNDVFVKVYLLSGVSPANVTSVALADGTVLPYNTTDGAYEKDVQYTSAVPTSANIVLTTANGTQTYTVLAQ